MKYNDRRHIITVDENTLKVKYGKYDGMFIYQINCTWYLQKLYSRCKIDAIANRIKWLKQLNR